MERCRSIMARFPERELELRRACARDVDFRAVCVDHGEAVSALRRFDEAGDPRADEYRKIVDELEEEILGLLERSRASSESPDERRNITH